MTKPIFLDSLLKQVIAVAIYACITLNYGGCMQLSNDSELGDL